MSSSSLLANNASRGSYQKVPTTEAAADAKVHHSKKWIKIDEEKHQKMRAISFESYALISGLLFNFTHMAIKWDHGDYFTFRDAQLKRVEATTLTLSVRDVERIPWHRLFGPSYFAPMDTYEVAFCFHMSCMPLCCCLCIYATVVFTLCAVYVRTAIAMDRYETAQPFLEQLQFQRTCAFRGFAFTVVFLLVDFIIVIFADLVQHGHGVPSILCIVLPSSCLFVVTVYQLQCTITEAGKTVFKPTSESAEVCIESSQESARATFRIGLPEN